ncbi:DNA replication and repair protein RecF [Candidatus Gottesmanbacteria bacterium]|nr:DNA replication and repair protein RecF [Candidatus Gottesmanbacteria bacterium]
MVLTNLSLKNFRNYTKANFSFTPAITVVVGSNASGKTNLLEAVFLLAAGKSFHAEQDREMIEFGKEVGRVEGAIRREEKEEIQLEIIVTKGEVMGTKTPSKKYSVNKVSKRMMDFVGRLKVVLFWPQDLELVTDSPSLRRRYLDFVLMQVDREYRRTLISYERGIRQRNKVLEGIQEGKAHRHQLIFWDQLLIKNGDYITRKREEYIEYINKSQKSLRPEELRARAKVKSQNLRFQLFYDKSIISQVRLDQYAKEEIAAGTTLVGPHRDDFQFSIVSNAPIPPLTLRGGEGELRDLSHFGSRGEQRLGILWLKLGELAFIEQAIGEKPVLLLDDILSELDHEHRKIIFEVIGNQQTILTTTDMHFIDKSLRSEKIIEL